MNNKRSSYQQGSLTTEKRKTGPAIWVYRWRETNTAGEVVHRKQVVGSKQTFPTKTAALRQVEGLRLDINKEAPAGIFKPLSVAELVKHYLETELAESNPSKTALTKSVYTANLDHHIVPKWGEYRLQDVRAILVETWLSVLPLAPGTRSKIRNIMSALFEHAMRYGWASANPIKQVRQSAKRVSEPDVLTAEEINSIIHLLAEPVRTITIAAALTGLRRGELFGLQWQDVDFAKGILYVRRSVVDQVVGQTKTAGSNRPMPLNKDLAAALHGWQKLTKYSGPTDWVFASPASEGSKPYWPDMILKRHIRPAAVHAEVTKRIGWHTFRRTFATLLYSSGANVKTTQELMRHATPTMTLGTYAQAVTSDKREAQDRLAALFQCNTQTNIQAASA